MLRPNESVSAWSDVREAGRKQRIVDVPDEDAEIAAKDL